MRRNNWDEDKYKPNGFTRINRRLYFGEYTRTKYRQIRGQQWKITELKRCLFFGKPGSMKNPYYLARIYCKRVNDEWLPVHCVRYDNVR